MGILKKFHKKAGRIAALTLAVCMIFLVTPETVSGANGANGDVSFVNGDVPCINGDVPLVDGDVTYVDEAPQSEVFKSGRIYADSPYWSQFSTGYFYDQLNTAQKEFYENLNAMCMNYLLQQTDMLSEGNTAYVSYSGLGDSEAQTVACIFIFSNPQYYFLNNSISQWHEGSSGQIALGVYDSFIQGSARSTYTSQVKAVLDGWNAQVAAGGSAYRKEQIAHDLVTGSAEYVETEYDQSVVSVLLYGKSVCSGYAKAFQMLCNAAGMETVCVTSTTHAWNKIYIYGNWYNVDVTWDDTTSSTNYFNVSDVTLSRGNNVHHIRNYWRTYTSVPSCAIDGIALPTVYNGTDYAAVYDYNYYVQKYADVRNAFGEDPEKILEHFVNYGMSEGRQAKEDFLVQAYRAAYKDLRTAFGSDLQRYYLHYIQYGKTEGRCATGDTAITDGVSVWEGVDYSPVYDYSYYVSNNPDVAAAFGDNDIEVLRHFVTYGMAEGREASGNFNVKAYRAAYADLRAAFGNDLVRYYIHYIEYGKNESRIATGSMSITDGITVYEGVDYRAVYDYSYYVSNNPDVAAAYGDDDAAVLKHFVIFGMKEGRQAKADFSVQIYRDRYPDLQQEFGEALDRYFLHFIQFGLNEGRSAV